MALRPGPSPPANVTGERDYLTEGEVEQLMQAARANRHGHRDSTAILVAYRHGLRAREVVALRWDDIDLHTELMRVPLTQSRVPVHPIGARVLSALLRLQHNSSASPYVFPSATWAPLTAQGYRLIVTRAGVAAELSFPINANMLRHGCAYKLANDGQDPTAIKAYLGHRRMKPTTGNTALALNQFRNFWRD